MKDRSLCVMMWVAVSLIALVLLVVYGLYLPLIAREMYANASEYRYAFWPCLAYSLGSALPCVAALVAFAHLIKAVSADQSFSRRTERAVRFISWMALFEGVYLFMGVVLSIATNVGSPGLVVILFGLFLIALAIGLLARVLATLIHRACALREENELTV